MAFEKYSVVDRVMKKALTSNRNDASLENYVANGKPEKIPNEEKIKRLEHKLMNSRLSFDEITAIQQEIKEQKKRRR